MRYLFPFLGFLWILLFLSRQTALAQEVYGTMDLFYQTIENKTEEKTERDWSFIQGYSLGFKNTVSPQMNYSIGVRANIDETNTKKTTTILPATQFNVTNDLFGGNLGYQVMERDPSDGPRFTSDSLNLNLNTKLENIPKIRLQYGQDRSYDHLEIHKIDNKNKRSFGGIQYRYHFLNMLYNYSQRETEDYVQDTVQQTEDHVGKLDFRKSLFEKKLFLNSGFAWNQGTTISKFKRDITIFEERYPYRGLYLYDTTPLFGVMNEMGSLIDGDYTTSTGINIGSTLSGGGTYHNMGVDLSSPQECEKIYLYTTSNYDPSLSNSYFTWAVYYSNNGTDWTLITNNANFDYDTLYYRFEIDFASQNARYFKAVNTSHDQRDIVGPVYITEIEVLGSEDRKAGEELKTINSGWEGNLNIIFRPIEKFSLGYNFSYDHTETDPGSIWNTEESHGANMSWKLHKYLSSSVQYQTRSDKKEGERSQTDNYSLQLNSSPMDTLGMSLSFNHSESEEEKTKTKTDSCLFHTAATLREGVDLSGNFHFTRSENATGTESTGKTIDLDLRTELTKKATFELGFDQSWQATENEGEATIKTESSNLSSTLNYSPSDILYLRGNIYFTDTEGEKDTSYGFNVSWLPTEKIQLNFDSRFDQNHEETNTYNLDSSWNISRYLIFRCGFNYSTTEGGGKDETKTLYARLSTRF